MRICLIALLLSVIWTLFAELTSKETAVGTEHPTTFGLAVIGIGTLAAYAWLNRSGATRQESRIGDDSVLPSVPVRYAESAAAAAQEEALESAEHAA